MTAHLIFLTVLGGLFFLINCWIAYYILKTAIRDGINESALISRWNDTVAIARRTSNTLPGIGEVSPDR